MSQLLSFYSAVIIGAGPAGCAIARQLALSGHKILLIDKALPGRPRICGGFLGPEIHQAMNKLGLSEAFNGLNLYPLNRLKLSSPSGRIFEKSFQAPGAYAVDRARWDQWLCERAQEAGAHTFFNAQVTHIHPHTNGYFLVIESEHATKTIVAKHLIRACGRRQPSLSMDHPENYFACYATFKGNINPANSVAMHFVPRAHVGINPYSSSEVTICLYAPSFYLQQSSGNLDLMLNRFSNINPKLSEDLKSLSRQSAWQTCRAVDDGKQVFQDKDGAYRVGDAVGMFNPIIGGGMPVAIESAALMADLLVQMDQKQKSQKWITTQYQHKWNHHFKNRYKAAKMAGMLEKSESLGGLTFGLLERFPFLFNSVASHARNF